MLSLLESRGTPTALPFLETHRGGVGLLLGARDLDRLPAAVRAAGIETRVLGPETPDDLRAGLPGTAGKLWLVVAPEGEAEALAALRAACPGHRFAGLGADLFPALLAWRPDALLGREMRRPGCRQLALVIAPPRSGSSFVTDILSALTGSKAREHLRRDTLDLLAAPYAFDRGAALRRFLDLAAGPDGRTATKLITHVALDYLEVGGRLTVLRPALSGLEVKAIIVDRTDRVAQAISGYLAAERRIWHLESPRDQDRLAAAAPVDYDFDAILAYHIGFGGQSHMLDFARRVFPDHLALDYERDIAAGDATLLGRKIAAHLGIAGDPGEIAVERARLANAENEAVAARFRADYRAFFGTDP